MVLDRQQFESRNVRDLCQGDDAVVLQLLSCAFGRHVRDPRTVRFDGEVFRGRCRGCGIELAREIDGWIVAPHEEDPDGGAEHKS